MFAGSQLALGRPQYGTSHMHGGKDQCAAWPSRYNYEEE